MIQMTDREVGNMVRFRILLLAAVIVGLAGIPHITPPGMRPSRWKIK